MDLINKNNSKWVYDNICEHAKAWISIKVITIWVIDPSSGVLKYIYIRSCPMLLFSKPQGEPIDLQSPTCPCPHNNVIVDHHNITRYRERKKKWHFLAIIQTDVGSVTVEFLRRRRLKIKKKKIVKVLIISQLRRIKHNSRHF